MLEKVSVELGKDVIKIVKGQFNKKIILNSYFDIQINNCIDWTDEGCSEKLLADLLRHAFDSNKLGRKNVNVVLSCMPNLLLREMVIPCVKEHDTYNIIRYEARDYFPVDINNYVIDYKVVETLKKDGIKKQKILTVVVPKNIVEKIKNVFQMAGIGIARVDIESNVLTKLIENCSSYSSCDKENVMILHMENKYVTTSIVKSGRLSMSKTFMEDLDSIVETKNDEDSEFNNSLMVNDIVENIVKVGNFFKSRENSEIESIFVAGKMAYSDVIIKPLTEKTGLNVQMIGESGLIEGSGDISKTDLCSYATAAGGLI